MRPSSPRSPSSGRSLTRRGFGGLSLAAVAAGLAACSSYDEDQDSAVEAEPAEETWTPTTVTHRYGSTDIPTQPTRVATVGLTEQDFLLALGVIPVALTDWYGDQPDGTWPWAHDLLEGAKPVVLDGSDGPPYPRIASTSPDLIVACNAGLTKKQYDRLSDLAPTITSPAGVPEYFASWKDNLPLIAQAVGRSAEAERVTAALVKKFADAKASHPEFVGKKAIFLQNAVYDGSLIAYQEGLSTTFLTDLGFEIPTEINEFSTDDAQAYIPVERIDVLDSADVLVWGTEQDSDRTALERTPGFSRLKAVRDGASIYTGGTTAGAIYFDSPLSLPYVVDTLVPMLEKADLTA